MVRTELPDLALRLYSPALTRELRRLLEEERFDALHVACLETTAAWLGVRSRLLPGARPRITVFDNHNAEYLLQWRAFKADLRLPRRWPLAAYSFLQSRKLRAYERRLCSFYNRTIAVSEEDAAALRVLNPRVEPLVVPNGVDCAQYPFATERAATGNEIVFTGTMDFRPNVDAVVWYAREVFPRVREQLPAARFTIVGKNPAPAVRALGERPGIVVTGAVPDVLPYLRAANLYVIPMRMGGGIRLKALEAMAAGVPALSTTMGFSGIAAEPGKHYLNAETAEEFARQTVAVLTGDIDVEPLRRAARALVEREYDWDTICERLAAVYGGT